MPTSLRIATFNMENFDDKENEIPTLAQRIAVMRPQLIRLRADILALQEIHGQEHPNQPRDLSALKALIQDTPYEYYEMVHTKTHDDEAYDEGVPHDFSFA